jgi:N5-(carboxyethyl)ornithine synthase
MRPAARSLTVGVIRTSLKENEKRVVIHPAHLDMIPEEVRRQLMFETGYGMPFGMKDDVLRVKCRGLASRSALVDSCDIVLLFKPMQSDFEAVKEGGILWGCPHFVQQRCFTQIAVNRRLTVIAIESMDIWGPKGERIMHAFQKISELGGYAGVLDALRTRGIDGRYGPPRKCLVFGFGSAGRGAVHALQGLGFQGVRVFTFRSPNVVANQIPGVIYQQVKGDRDGHMIVLKADGSYSRVILELAEADIIVNAMLQDPDEPKMIIAADELHYSMKPGVLIVDASCDEGMGFPFARPTTFEQPILALGNAFYYAVDHTPSYLWDSASWEISKCFIHYLPVVVKGEESWNRNQTVKKAIEIRNGVIQNPKILSYQRREKKYPHRYIDAVSAASLG